MLFCCFALLLLFVSSSGLCSLLTRSNRHFRREQSHTNPPPPPPPPNFRRQLPNLNGSLRLRCERAAPAAAPTPKRAHREAHRNAPAVLRRPRHTHTRHSRTAHIWLAWIPVRCSLFASNCAAAACCGSGALFAWCAVLSTATPTTQSAHSLGIFGLRFAIQTTFSRPTTTTTDDVDNVDKNIYTHSREAAAASSRAPNASTRKQRDTLTRPPATQQGRHRHQLHNERFPSGR